MSRDFLAPYKYLDEVAATTVGIPIAMGQSGINGITFHNVWNTDGTATLAGAVKIEASNDPALNGTALSAAEQSAADWVDITAELTITDPTSGEGRNMIIVNNTRFWWIRLTLTVSGGTGVFSCYPASHGAG